VSPQPYPAYLGLAASDELHRRAQVALGALTNCSLCPRDCRADRVHDRTGTCGIGRLAWVASYGPHLGEEDCLRGWRGSGTIFLAGCNLRCAFCQNWEISHEQAGAPVDADRLAAMMLELQAEGCHNINWVTPSPVVPQLIEALAVAADRGLRLPIVYNSSGYDAVPTLRWLDGVVDIYLPDFKVWDIDTAARLLHARDYPEIARAALREMHRQVGRLVFDAQGLARRGLLVRHLVLPANQAGTAAVSRWLAHHLSANTYVNVMDQYRPAGEVLQAAHREQYADIAHQINDGEYARAVIDVRAAGLHRLDRRGA